MQILAETAHWVAIDKAAGYLSVPSRMGVEDERPVAGKILEAELGVRLWPVHRLDFDVSGILLFAKTAECHKFLNAAFDKETSEASGHGVVKKTYHALSARNAEPAAHKKSADIVADAIEHAGKVFTLQSLLVAGKKRSFVAEHGKKSVTEIVFIGKKKIGALEAFEWKLSPLTGRRHQLRVHMNNAGHALIGDELYGSPHAREAGGVALRAMELDFSKLDQEKLKKFEIPKKLSGF